MNSKRKISIIIFCIVALFLAFVIMEVNKSSKIPDHIHSIDDKAAEERTDDENILLLQRSWSKNPKDVIIMLQLALLYQKTSEIDKAKELYQDVLEIDPGNDSAEAHLKKLN